MNARRTLVVVILGVLGAPFAPAQQAPPPSQAKEAPEAGKKMAPRPGARAAGGLVVFIDPVTGKIREPDAAEIGSIVSPPSAVTPPVEEPLVMKVGPGGAVAVVLDSRFESFMVVTKAPDGKLAMDCVIGSKKADEAVSGGAKTAKKQAGKEAPRVP